MNFIRQNTPFVLKWDIELLNSSICLEDVKLSVVLSCARGRISLTDYIEKVEGNIITINVSKGLAFIGEYSIKAKIESEQTPPIEVGERDVFQVITKSDPSSSESLVEISSSVLGSVYDSVLSEKSYNAIQNAAVAKEFAKLRGEGPGSIKEFVDNGIGEVLGGASEAYDTLKEIEEYIEKDEAGAAALAQSIAKIPFVCDAYGKGAIQKNGNNTPLMGYYFKAVNSGSRRIILSSKQGYTGETVKENIICQYEVGDVISVAGAWDDVNRDCATITEIHAGYIVVDNIPTVYDNEVLSHMSYSIFVQKKPHIGLSCLVEGTVAIGSDNVAQNDNTTMVGSGLKTTNSGEMAVGRYNHSYPETTMGSGDGTEFSWGVGNAGVRKNLFEVIEGKVYLLGVGGYKGNNAIGSKDITCLNPFLDITYAGLKQLRNNGSLIPGRLYRITDYITTTTQTNTKSAGHPFDVIVLALDENTLSERAWAIQSERDADGYFASSKLEAWQIWYCVDNDTSRFAWADTENGKGVIYRMIDEWNNDIPYDFKNILFNTGAIQYTFGGESDCSLNKRRCFNNTILPFFSNGLRLNRILFGAPCHDNTFGSNCQAITLGGNCYNNTFGAGCYSNYLGENCYYNTFGVDCYSNSFGESCIGNRLGNSCYSNEFRERCVRNQLESYCYGNKIMNHANYNYFGLYCRYIIIGPRSVENRFGAGCSYLRFLKNAGDLENPLSYATNNIIEDGVQFIEIVNEYTGSQTSKLQNIKVCAGTKGVSKTNLLTIQVERNRVYQTTVAKDSAGNVKQFCIADVIL